MDWFLTESLPWRTAWFFQSFNQRKPRVYQKQVFAETKHCGQVPAYRGITLRRRDIKLHCETELVPFAALLAIKGGHGHMGGQQARLTASAQCLQPTRPQCFDTVGWAAGMASGL